MSPPRAEQLAQDGPARVGLAFARGVQGLAQVAGALPAGDEFRVERIVQRARQHLLTLGWHPRLQERVRTRCRNFSASIMVPR